MLTCDLGVHLKKDTLRSSSLLLFGVILPCRALEKRRRIFPLIFFFPTALGFTLLLPIGLTNITGHLLSARHHTRCLEFKDEEYNLCSQGVQSLGLRQWEYCVMCAMLC